MRDNEQPILFPEVLAESSDANTLILELRVPESLAYFVGHFPGTPIVPGVVQVNWAIQFARKKLGLDIPFRHMEAIKFKELLLPGQRIRLILRWQAAKKKLEFSFRSETGEYSSGRIYFQAGDV